MKRFLQVASLIVFTILAQDGKTQLIGGEASYGSDMKQGEPFFRRSHSLIFSIPKNLRLTIGSTSTERIGKGPEGPCYNCTGPYNFSIYTPSYAKKKLNERIWAFSAMLGKSIALNEQKSIRLVGSAGPVFAYHSKVSDFELIPQLDSFGNQLRGANYYTWQRKTKVKGGIAGEIRLEFLPKKHWGIYLGTSGQALNSISFCTFNLGIMVGKMRL